MIIKTQVFCKKMKNLKIETITKIYKKVITLVATVIIVINTIFTLTGNLLAL